MFKYYFFIFILFPQLSISQDWIREDMDKITADENIEIYYRYLVKDGFTYLEFKGETIINSDLSNIVSIVGDASKMHKWVYNLDSVKYEKINDRERYIYMVHKSGWWFLDQRDSYIHTIASQNPKSYEVVLKGVSAPMRGPEKDEFVRIKKGESKWRFYPEDVNRTKITFQGYANPGGNIQFEFLLPLQRSELLKLPFVSLSNLKNIVKQGDFNAKKIDWIMNKPQ